MQHVHVPILSLLIFMQFPIYWNNLAENKDVLMICVLFSWLGCSTNCTYTGQYVPSVGEEAHNQIQAHNCKLVIFFFFKQTSTKWVHIFLYQMAFIPIQCSFNQQNLCRTLLDKQYIVECHFLVIYYSHNHEQQKVCEEVTEQIYTDY